MHYYYFSNGISSMFSGYNFTPKGWPPIDSAHFVSHLWLFFASYNGYPWVCTKYLIIGSEYGLKNRTFKFSKNVYVYIIFKKDIIIIPIYWIIHYEFFLTLELSSILAQSLKNASPNTISNSEPLLTTFNRFLLGFFFRFSNFQGIFFAGAILIMNG